MCKMRTNLSLKFYVFFLVAIMILTVPLSIILGYDQYHFPADSLSNHPGTQWICEQLALKFSVDENGMIFGEYTGEDKTIVLDVISHPSDSGHANHIKCTGDNGEIELTCFYRNISKGMFYAIIEFTGTSAVVNDAKSVPYKFERQGDSHNISPVQLQKDGYTQESHLITGLCVGLICVTLLLLERKMNALQSPYIKHTDPCVLKTGKKYRFLTVFLTAFSVMITVFQLLMVTIPFTVLVKWIFSKNTSWLDFEMVAIAVVNKLYIILPMCVLGCLCSLAIKLCGIKARKFGCNTKILRLADVISLVTYQTSVIICWFMGLNTIAYIIKAY